ncbi:hypothetical protein P3X46_030981 [Hevea brasiliensis]|uniref:Pentacotripeptide-repeat region of PRORP domain-containing protein n=1 Tax=Hevea brasiliensis TaxID=3981 RepID=A0ABQ9KIU7_HEVBR|nr:putative pentatricopeptide repeat-containing protein At1g03510 isoform X2 [Hevea brasiliensis]KAJ9140321.1 hypothetical protein P3X46_030981 [Hevea brasiliensis]
MMSYSSNYLRLISWTKQLTSHVNQGLHRQALALFRHMQTSLALSLDPCVFPLLLKSCSAIHRPQLGTAVHSHAVKMGLLSNPFVACALVDVHGLPGVEDGSSKAIAFYRQMRELGLKPNLITLLALLPACVGLAALSLIEEIHGYSIRNGIDPHPQLRSGLVDAYGRCGCLINATNVFHSMKERDVVAWSSLISAYALLGEARSALQIFRQMEMAKVCPDDITFLAVLKACSHAGLADEALDYFSRMQEDYGLQANSDHYSCLVDVLSRAGRLNEAYKVIREMPVKVTAKAWGALLGACRTYGEVELAEIAGRALFEIEPDNPANYVILARIYASVGRHEEAQRMRREMTERGVKVAPGSSWVV